MRYCGIDVSARAAHQQLVTLHERRTGGDAELVATFYALGDAVAVARTVLGFGRASAVAIGAPAGRRLDLLAPGGELHAALGLRAGRYDHHRVCDALLFARGLPLYPIPGPQAAARQAWERWLEAGFGVHGALDAIDAYRPQAPLALEGPAGRGALGFGRRIESYPDAIFSVLLGHRPGPKHTPWGLQQRIAALKLRGVVDADGGLWHRTLDELDACALAYASHAFAGGSAWWAGDAREGVVVLPVPAPADRYERLPPPARAALA
jgi:Protein of unknown function (DUF429)